MAGALGRLADAATRELRARAAIALLRSDDGRDVIAGGGALPATIHVDPSLVLALAERSRRGRWRFARDADGARRAALLAALGLQGLAPEKLCGAAVADDDGSLAGVLVLVAGDHPRTIGRAAVLRVVGATIGAWRHLVAAAAAPRLDAIVAGALDEVSRENPAGVAIVDADGRVAAGDAAFARLAGVPTAADLVGREVTALGLPPALTSGLLARARSAVACEEVDLGDARARRHLELRAALVDGPAEGRNLLMLRVSDTSAQHDLAVTLQSSRERLRLLERATNDVLWEWRVREGTVEWNGNGHRHFRFLADEVRTDIEWHVSRIHPDDRERIVSGMQSVVAGVVETWRDEYRFLRGDGSYAWILNRACIVRNERGEAERVVGWMVDVSERRRAEQAQRFLSAAGALLDAGLSVEGMMDRIARHATTMLGDCCMVVIVNDRSDVDCVAIAHVSAPHERKIHEWLADQPDTCLGDEMPFRRVIEAREPMVMSSVHAAPSSLGYVGPLRLGPVELCSYLIVPVEAHGQVLGTLMFGTGDAARRYGLQDLMVGEELARRVALALDNARLYETARRALRERQEVLGLVSHDLRTPLSSIVLSASLLHEDGQLVNPDVRRRLEGIMSAAEQMNTLIADLLDASRIESGHFVVRVQPQEPAALIRQVEDLFSLIAEGRGLQLRVELAEELRPVLAERDQLARVLSNLIGNSIKFTPRGGSITVRATQRPCDVLFSVEDTGPGLTPEQADHVFEPFWTAERSPQHGSGLGLAIAHGIVQAHGGQLWVDRRWTRGSRFVFTIPCEPTCVATGEDETTEFVRADAA